MHAILIFILIGFSASLQGSDFKLDRKVLRYGTRKNYFLLYTNSFEKFVYFGFREKIV